MKELDGTLIKVDSTPFNYWVKTTPLFLQKNWLGAENALLVTT